MQEGLLAPGIRVCSSRCRILPSGEGVEASLLGELEGLPHGLNLLLVEDEPLIALDGQLLLQAMGARVVLASDAAAAARAVEEDTFHAAILDVRLGSDTSAPLARRLEQLAIPYGLLTGFGREGIPPDLQHCPVVSKPFAARDLALLVRTLVAKRVSC